MVMPVVMTHAIANTPFHLPRREKKYPESMGRICNDGDWGASESM